uniref:Uncharacterized protein n=1 Tax=Arundo donax TaxID=35708 RepID=A0A0A9B3C4_ARUDO
MQFHRLLPRLLIHKHLILQQPTHLQFLRLPPHRMRLHRCPNLQHPVCHLASLAFSCNQHQGLVLIACLGFLPRMEHHPIFLHRLLSSLLPQINKYLSQASSHKLAYQLNSQL